MEATGCYSEALAEFLHNTGHFVSVVNPACIRFYAKSKLIRQKNDQTDAEIIADYCQRQEPIRWAPPSPELKKLKHLYRCSAALKDELTLVNNHLEKKERLPKEVANAWEDLAMNIKQKIERIKNSLRELLNKHKELLENFQLLLTIPGIGEESAVAILAEVPNIKAFKDARQLAAYAGAIPRNITSGTLDRLSRETKDSIEVTSFFRRHRVNFVAVTQIFDNNTPMGKFVQTVLSGAAQLEREMIVERVKNKIATSKEQGLWMGGTLPLGYDVKDKELIINEKEAKTVKHIFERYLELRSMAELARELNNQGYRTKSDIFKKATVRRIITNPIYMGKIRHYDKQYEGKHKAIIEEEKWQKAQELIKDQPYRKAKYEEALLRGIIKCKSCGVNMTLTYAKKENKRYRYYVCNNHLRGKNCESGSRNVVAGEVEKEVIRRAELLYENLEEKAEEWKNLSFREQKEVVKKLIKGVMIKEDGIEVSLEDKVEFTPIKKKGNKCTVIEPEGKTNNALLKAVVRAHSWKRQLEEGKYGSVKELSAKINIGTRRMQQILRLNYLAPKIKEDIVNGRQPRGLRLVDLREIPMLWSEQMEKFYGLNLQK